MKNITLTILLFLFSISVNAQKSCMDDDLVIAATGDTIFHGSLLVQAFKPGKQGGFDNLWKETTKYLQQADLMYTNLEGPVAPGLYSNGSEDLSMAETYHPTNGMYSIGEAGKSYTFNFHPESVRSLVRSGFTLFSTANNHSLDRRVKGLNKTINFLNGIRVNHFGTKYSSDPIDQFVSIVNKNGMKLAFIGCTYGSNVNIKTNQVLFCYQGNKPNQELLNLVKTYNNKVDAVIVTPHWGSEYAEVANKKQKNMAKRLVDAGAKAIIGHHPHIVQPMEYIVNRLGVKVPVLYSLGNFVTNQAPSNWKNKEKNESRFKRRVGAVAFLGFSRVDRSVSVSSVKLLPTYMKIQYEGERGMRSLFPAYGELVAEQKQLAKSLKKAMKYFKTKFSKEIININWLRGSIVCQ